MNKVIKVDEQEVLIIQADQSIITVKREELSFEPKIGDVVEVYAVGDTFVVNPQPTKEKGTAPTLTSMNEKVTQLSKSEHSSKFKIFGWISAVVSIFFLPVIFGIIGIALGFLYSKTDKKQGHLIMIVSGVALIIGLIIAIATAGDDTIVYFWY
ncbi:hypothetical protein BFC19_07605 [Brochothrix thermosphacta]|uniref:hypothetical protein n=1 Tax=Brochothrix thermosphacta TaxID=2756 RepID=UPI000E75902B|nr:hypothetical protein [Brochothrix thermosphacta]ANZ95253.1 hypothetical protein BFC19_07605 [Brochothrix thermosphacta]MDO7864069.1 hypothetical protein [Brochothrix thermosphacta]